LVTKSFGVKGLEVGAVEVAPPLIGDCHRSQVKDGAARE
jgi:hypothetical protein